MPLEDRLRLMMLQEGDRASTSKLAAEEQRERRLRRGANSPERTTERPSSTDQPKFDSQPDVKEPEQANRAPPRISRESILRKVQSQNLRESFDDSSPVRSPSPEDSFLDAFDPDTPLPSLEGRAPVPEFSPDTHAFVKHEEDGENGLDLYSIPQVTAAESSQAGRVPGSLDEDDEPVRDADAESQYSTDAVDVPSKQTEAIAPRDELPKSLTVGSGTRANIEELRKKHRLSFAQFSTQLGDEDFGASFSTYMTACNDLPNPASLDTLAAAQLVEFARPQTPNQSANLYDGSGYGMDDEFDHQSTPESVIRRSISEYSEPEPEPEPEPVPEPVATIKAPGGKLKTRASLAPADVKAMAETRRQVSGESRTGMPALPEKSRSRPSVIPEADSFMPDSSFNPPDEPETEKAPKRRSSLVQLDVTMEEPDEGLSFGIDKEFDRLIEARKVASTPFSYAYHVYWPPPDITSQPDAHFQALSGAIANRTFRKQNGYLMRQNTKVVIASSASNETTEANQFTSKSAGNSPVKRNNSNAWTTEPWNGKARRRSIRQSAASPMKKPAAGPAPPLPGMSSNVTAGTDESEMPPEFDEFDESGERGRLFVKVVGVKDLELQLPRGTFKLRESMKHN